MNRVTSLDQKQPLKDALKAYATNKAVNAVIAIGGFVYTS